MIFELNKRNKWLFIVAAVLLAAPFLYAVRYAVPSADDFTFAVAMRNGKEEMGSYLHAGWRVMKQHLESQGGRWFDHLIIIFVFRFGINIHLIHLMLFLLIVLFLSSNYFFLKEMAQNYYRIEFAAPMLFLVFLIGLNLSSPCEVFYWFSGAVGYMLAPALNLFSFALYFRFIRCGRRQDLILSSLLMYLSCGSVQCSITFMFALFICVGFTYIYENGIKDKKRLGLLFIPVVAGAAGALTNLLAPGTWVRHKVYSPAGLHLLPCIMNTFKVTVERFLEIMMNGYFLFSLVVILCIVLCNRDLTAQIKLKLHPVIIMLMGLLCGCAWFFPYITGCYTDGSYGIARRVLYIGDWILAGSFVIFSVHLCVWLTQKHNGEAADFKKFYPPAIIACIAAFIFSTGATGVRNVKEVVLLTDLYKGTCKEMYTQEMNLLNEVKTSEEQNVYVKPIKVKSDILFEIALGEWDSWGNEAIAQWYGKWAVVCDFSDT